VTPDWVLVQGDTTTAMTASLAAFYRRIKVGHVEAGLRTGDKHQPFPEEINRRITSVVADLHFAPTEWAAGNLRREGVPDDRIVVTGNTVIDAIQDIAARPFDPIGTFPDPLPWQGKRLILVTAHRRENFGQGILDICAALETLASTRDDIHIVYPVHPNPNILEPVTRLLGNVPNITLLPPLEYQPMVWLMQQSYLVISDSGGIQEEAPGLGKPVLVLRETTERPEGVEAGTVRLVGTDTAAIIANASELLDCAELYERMAKATNPYGNGNARARIIEPLDSTAAPVRLPLETLVQ
jgi:UDP-N-acetylglucosamine 2-epimerase (non-hydrolysing)